MQVEAKRAVPRSEGPGLVSRSIGGVSASFSSSGMGKSGSALGPPSSSGMVNNSINRGNSSSDGSNNGSGFGGSSGTGSATSHASMIHDSSLARDPRINMDEYAYNKIFVGGLHYDTRDNEFKMYFERYGKVISAEVMFNRETHKSRGFGFVVFEEERFAEAVCADIEHVIDGKVVEVKRAIPRSKLMNTSLSVAPGSIPKALPTTAMRPPLVGGSTNTNSSPAKPPLKTTSSAVPVNFATVAARIGQPGAYRAAAAIIPPVSKGKLDAPPLAGKIAMEEAVDSSSSLQSLGAKAPFSYAAALKLGTSPSTDLVFGQKMVLPELGSHGSTLDDDMYGLSSVGLDVDGVADAATWQPHSRSNSISSSGRVDGTGEYEGVGIVGSAWEGGLSPASSSTPSLSSVATAHAPLYGSSAGVASTGLSWLKYGEEGAPPAGFNFAPQYATQWPQYSMPSRGYGGAPYNFAGYANPRPPTDTYGYSDQPRGAYAHNAPPGYAPYDQQQPLQHQQEQIQAAYYHEHMQQAHGFGPPFPPPQDVQGGGHEQPRDNAWAPR